MILRKKGILPVALQLWFNYQAVKDDQSISVEARQMAWAMAYAARIVGALPVDEDLFLLHKIPGVQDTFRELATAIPRIAKKEVVC